MEPLLGGAAAGKRIRSKGGGKGEISVLPPVPAAPTTSCLDVTVGLLSAAGPRVVEYAGVLQERGEDAAEQCTHRSTQAASLHMSQFF